MTGGKEIFALSSMAKSSILPFILLLLLVGFGENASADNTSVNACAGWRTSVESGNARDWDVVPASCVSDVGNYMENGQYLLDFKIAVQQCLAYLNDSKLVGDGKDAWVFDTDDTTLSCLSYYRTQQYGGAVFNSTSFNEWVEKGTATVLPSSLQLYNALLKKGVEIFILTGRDEEYRELTTKNLMAAGYSNWAGLIMRGDSDQGTTALVYKSEKRGELVKKGYRIWGNCGDQWSDITGNHTGYRTFKMPNPMYYIS
ncbi:hypothetical protein SUGI_1175900 [Cryptomeria japonica]|uniref:acid phosphatase 1 n=1 Tax=Cryptomeria japonica TaxID=3369 RepID=UPI0024148C99|nr:acid phosphatase 1 [Cryptomeria japonica]GLJ54743.1 hypothetical protein SUGI_1175900 [Cryptomeria japonica]